MVKQVFVAGLLLPGIMAPTIASHAQAPASPKAPPTAATVTPPAAATKKDEPKKEEPEKNIDETIKDYQKMDGLFTLYRKKKGATDTLMMEVNAKQLNKLYLLQATASTGLTGIGPDIFQGQPLNDQPFRLQLVDDSRIVFVQPDLNFRAPGDAVMQRAIDNNYPSALLGSFEIKARQKNRDTYLIDVSELFKGDFAEVGSYLGEGPGSYTFDKAFSYVDSLKMFPENMVVRTSYKLNRVGNRYTGPKSVPFAVSYNFSVLPDTGYKPRLADARVGYFLTSYNDVSDNSSYDRNVNYILRWNVEKADPSLPLSPPKKPIKWYISNTVPVKYRAAVRRGLLMYNTSFEKIGIKDAIVVEQMPDNADWDIADVRYNIIRWTDSVPFAIALFRANPQTGEILNAAINFDGGFASSGAAQFDVTVDPIKAFPSHFPEAQAKSDTAAAKRRFGLGVNSLALCQDDFLKGASQSAEFGMTALSLLETPGTGIPFDKEKFIEEFITEVTAHEFGHCLGLRHNYIASTQYTMEQLKDGDLLRKNGVTSTVMEYTPFNIGALKQKNTPYYSQTVGSYDNFAVEYGYKPLDAPTPEAEKPQLLAIASKSGIPGNAWMGDGLSDAYDPAIARFDLGKEPLDYVSRTLEVSRYLMGTLDTRLPKKGGSYYEYSRSYNSLLNQYLNSLRFATRYVGGMRLSASHKGDPNEKLPLVPLDAAKQKEALTLVTRAVLSKDSLAFTKRGMAKLTNNPNTPGLEGGAEARRFPLRDRLSSFQAATLLALFSPTTQGRIANNEFRSQKPGDTLSLATLYRTVGASVWSEVGGGSAAATEIDPLRRDLQRAHLDLLIATVTGRTPGVPRDGVSLAWEQLRTLKGQITKALPSAQGEYGKPHLTESLQRINRTLSAGSVINN